MLSLNTKELGELNKMTEDQNNFKLKIGKWNIIMAHGELEINNCGYDTQDQNDDPTYDFVRELWRMKRDDK